MSHTIWTSRLIWVALLLIYGALCALLGGVVVSARTRRSGAGLLPDPATMTAMNTPRANHPDEFARLLGAETARHDGGNRG